MGEFKVHTETQTSTEKAIQSDVLDTNRVVYNDTNWLNNWTVNYGGFNINVVNNTKVINGRGNQGANYYIIKNKKSNNNVAFRTAITRDEFVKEVLVYDSGEQYGGRRRVWSIGDGGYWSSKQPWHWEYPDVEPNWKYNDAWIVNLYGYSVNIKNGARYNNNGRGSRGVNYYRCERTGRNNYWTDTIHGAFNNPVQRWTDGEPIRRGQVYEGQYRSRYTKYNKGSRSCDIYEGRYELKKFILFNRNVNKFSLDFDNSVEYLNSLPNDNDKLYEELKDYIKK